MNRWWILGIVTLALISTMGCGGGTKHDIVPVQGTVAFADGSKLPAGTQLLFNPSEGGVGASVGTTSDDGSFEVVHPSGSKGAEEGKYTVQLRPPTGQDVEFYKEVKPEFYDPGALTAEVKSGMSPLSFVVERTN